MGLEAALEDVLGKLPIPKLMQYQLADGWTTVGFVRPAHGLVALHGSEVVPVRALGLDAGRSTLGHRFEAACEPIVLRSADSYETQLREQGAVIAGFAERRAEIVRQLNAASAAENLAPVDDEALLDEVTGLVERPKVLVCEFDREFLAVPPECLILTMKANQKYFPLLDASGALTNRFLVVSNIAPADPSRVVEGNERVVRPRLADAKFFFDQDRSARSSRACRRSTRSSITASSAARATACGACAASRAGVAGADRRRRRCGGARGPAREGRPAHRHGRRVPGAAGRHGRLLRGARRRSGGRRRGDPRSVHQPARRRGRRTRRGTSSARHCSSPIGPRCWSGHGESALKPTGDKDPYALRRHG
jgi:hypothetical protein